MTDTFLDGGGVLSDRELPAGTRLRFRPDPEHPELDLTAWVENGVLVVAGPWSVVSAWLRSSNRVELRGILPTVIPNTAA